MAEIPPALRPVVHDPCAFHDAIAELDATLARLDEALDDRMARVRGLMVHWHGRAADRFAGDLTARLVAVHQDVVGELRATRRNLVTTLDAIGAEDATRARRRDHWRWEQAQQAAGSS